ncbi:hypothetical protein UPYG_G00090680 [Umbra pygmaea]|uniref:Uncharacterized protein n=1 Tax=Umbra pygmaea TaxID=75934 RepID=A0ABD0XUV9_UMBPY
MSANTSKYFPSLYDESNPYGNIWSSILLNYTHCSALKKSHQAKKDQRLHQDVVDPERWPETGILVITKYQPLEVFSTPTSNTVQSTRKSEMDEVNELAILMTELKLGAQMGEHLDRGRYDFLNDLHTSLIQKLRRDRYKYVKKL